MDSVLVNPTETTTAQTFSLAPRKVLDLRGKTVGLLSNTKFNSDTLLDAIGGLLEERCGVEQLVRERKPYFARPVPDDMAKDLADRCDVVITAIGD